MSATLSPRTTVVTAASIALFVAALSFLPAWGSLELKGFDLLSVKTAPMRSSLPITIVAIDEGSIGAIGLQLPWPRALHAKLVDRLTEAGAMLIVFDMLLSEPSMAGAADDAAMSRSIAKNGNVIIAADRVYEESAHGRRLIRIEPLEEFRKAGATSAFAGVSWDSDFEIRNVPQGDDIMWRVVGRRVNELRPGMLDITEPERRAMIRYTGPDHTFPYIPYSQVLDGLPKDALADNIVIVGRDLRASTDQGAAQGDLFYTPFTPYTGWLTPGAEVHANIIESVFRGDTVTPASDSSRLLLLIAISALAAWSMRRWRPIVSGIVGAVIVVAIAAMSWGLFTYWRMWLPVFAAMASVATTYLVFGAMVFIMEQVRKNEIRRAFALYVSPEVVSHVLEHPDKLKLGGERREVTMLFSDLEGFTPLTERLGAEQVAKILNMHFTRATAIIKRHGGTVNRFIGDAIMAMWGAPVDDPRQSSHAVLAAVEVQRDMVELRRELVAQGLPEIRMRIGIHTCIAVIGNLGSSDRFDYTAIGDGVNLAARLEGVNKLYGTGILVSGETVAKLEGAVPLRLVDRVIVKGKSEPVEIYTPCDDAAVVATSAEAIEAYRARRWDESERLWRDVLKRDPADTIAQIYVERVGRCRTTAPDAGWDGVAELEKL